MHASLLVLALAISQPSADRPLQFMSKMAGTALAERTGRPIVEFVGVSGRRIEGFIICESAGQPMVVVTVKGISSQLPANATDYDIQQLTVVREIKAKVVKDDRTTLAEAYKKSLDSGLPLAVYVGSNAYPISGFVTASVSALSGYPNNCVVVAIPKDGDLIYRATLNTQASESDISRAIGGEPRLADPFQSRPATQSRIITNQSRSSSQC